jgi:hypothetical protein
LVDELDNRSGVDAAAPLRRRVKNGQGPSRGKFSAFQGDACTKTNNGIEQFFACSAMSIEGWFWLHRVFATHTCWLQCTLQPVRRTRPRRQSTLSHLHMDKLLHTHDLSPAELVRSSEYARCHARSLSSLCSQLETSSEKKTILFGGNGQRLTSPETSIVQK